MSFSKQEIRDKALRILKLLATGQPAVPEHAQIVDDVVDAAQAFLESKGIAYWPANEIPNGAADGFRNYVAARAAPELPGAEVVTSEAQALRDLYEFTATKNGRVAFTYF
ncbi:MAG: hypothetical protein JKY81_01785 [Colwellia sp.]|nr:hypothetical protein [Colwellia sp.]